MFLYESLSAVLGAAVLVWLSSRPRPSFRVGDLGAIALIWIGGFRFLLEFLRIGNWRIADIPTAQIFGAGLVVIGLGMIWLRRRQGAPMLAPVEPSEDEDEDGDEDDEDDDDDEADEDGEDEPDDETPPDADAPPLT